MDQQLDHGILHKNVSDSLNLQGWFTLASRQLWPTTILRRFVLTPFPAISKSFSVRVIGTAAEFGARELVFTPKALGCIRMPIRNVTRKSFKGR
jgi:hypothetical protein